MSVATMHTNHGAIELELFDGDAPKTVENFRTLAANGFYDGVIFHRVPNVLVVDPAKLGGGSSSELLREILRSEEVCAER